MTTMTRSHYLKRRAAFILFVFLLTVAVQPTLFAKKKKQAVATTAEQPATPVQDTSELVWPAPPNVGRVRYIQYFAGQKVDLAAAAEPKKKPKQSWMDRLAGVQPSPTGKLKLMPFQLLGPFGMAVTSEGELLVADQKVGAVFAFNTETRDAKLIRNGFEATFGWIN